MKKIFILAIFVVFFCVFALDSIAFDYSKARDKMIREQIISRGVKDSKVISAMEKAAAFVTDHGGATCHAAIVAREMKKPCIIGTKIGTKVFKDGDIVIVDGKKGVVKKVN